MIQSMPNTNSIRYSEGSDVDSTKNLLFGWGKFDLDLVPKDQDRYGGETTDRDLMLDMLLSSGWESIPWQPEFNSAPTNANSLTDFTGSEPHIPCLAQLGLAHFRAHLQQCDFQCLLRLLTLQGPGRNGDFRIQLRPQVSLQEPVIL